MIAHSNETSLRTAVVGCLHGLMSKMYEDIMKKDEEDGKKTDLVILCGDIQVDSNYESP